MFTILISQFNDAMKQELKSLCSSCEHILIFEGKTTDELLSFASDHSIDCFLFYLDTDFNGISRIIYQLREMEAYAHTPLFLFSSEIEYLVSSFIHWKTCEFFLLPMGNCRKAILKDLLQHYAKLYQKMHPEDAFLCRLQTAKGIYNIPYDDILFIESTMKKSVIHTKNNCLALPTPLYRMREILPSAYFVQTHRSFIINLKNTSLIDKTKEPWTISFFDCQKAAYVSRNYKKDLMLAISAFPYCSFD